MDLFQILACPGDLVPIFKFIKHGVFPIIQIGIPILLILMGSIDLGRAVLSSDDKEVKAATGRLIKRAIAAIAVFFVSTLVSLIMGMLGTESDNGRMDTGVEVAVKDTNYSWKDCWDE